ncbi:MAG: hypothetical protein SCH71_05575 [Desulfobulbaceae bacterium]|nr:hypothetical protein [Desulfobulbaceae bacterium]
MAYHGSITMKSPGPQAGRVAFRPCRESSFRQRKRIYTVIGCSKSFVRLVPRNVMEGIFPRDVQEERLRRQGSYERIRLAFPDPGPISDSTIMPVYA